VRRTVHGARHTEVEMDEREDVDRVATAIAEAQRVVVLTGAGVSTGSGIPDYRGPQGVWTRDPAAERLSTIDAYLEDAAVRREVWRQRLSSGIFGAEPNAAHRALATLEALGRLDTLITQNVDGLHLAAGSSPDRVIEVHGTVHEVVCLSCEDRGPAAPVLDRVRAGEDDPSCPGCGGVLKSATISFGQALDQDDLFRAHDAAASCDVFLAAGTSLAVYPVAGLPEVAASRGAWLAIANADPTPFDGAADAVLRGDVADVLTRIVGEVQRRLR
jgi:NAD-dependent deacetylase